MWTMYQLFTATNTLYRLRVYVVKLPATVAPFIIRECAFSNRSRRFIVYFQFCVRSNAKVFCDELFYFV